MKRSDQKLEIVTGATCQLSLLPQPPRGSEPGEFQLVIIINIILPLKCQLLILDFYSASPPPDYIDLSMQQ